MSADHIPEKATEITPKMIEAGVRELVGFNEEFERREDLVARVYEAMAALAPLTCPPLS